jgi:sulfatase maturation enzyme AslB (radical SAM superfamily)
MLETPLSEILSDSVYRDVCRLKMGEILDHNERCRDCEYRLHCGAGCRALACGEESTDYKGIDEDCCAFFKNGWYEKAKAAIERYAGSFPASDDGETGEAERPEDRIRDDIC